jgi:hypothetical protein
VTGEAEGLARGWLRCAIVIGTLHETWLLMHGGRAVYADGKSVRARQHPTATISLPGVGWGAWPPYHRQRR